MIINRVVILLLAGVMQAFAQSPDTLRLSLVEALDIASQHAAEVRIAAAVRTRIEENTRRQNSLPPPQVSVEYGFIPRASNPSNYGERTIAIDQVIPSPFSWYYAFQEGAAIRSQAKAEEAAAVQLLMNRVRLQYWRLAAQSRRTVLAEAQFTRSTKLAEATKLRFEAGEVGKAEVLASQAMLSQAHILLERQRMQEQLESYAFAAAIGRGELADKIRYAPTDSFRVIPLPVEENQLVNTVLERSASIAAARSSVEAAKASSRQAYSDVLPAFSVGIMDQRQAGFSASYGFRVGLSVPLWFAFDQRRGILGAEARVLQSEAELELVIQSIRIRVLSRLEEFRMRSREAERYEQSLLPDAEALVDITEKAWIAGETSFLDVIQARKHQAQVNGDGVDAVLSSLESWTEILTLLNLEEK